MITMTDSAKFRLLLTHKNCESKASEMTDVKCKFIWKVLGGLFFLSHIC